MSWGIGDRVGVAVGIGNIASFLSKSIQSRSPQPSLVLDFAGTGTLDSRITFTRSTTATYYNSSGILSTAAANVARFDYNPSTLAPLGLLIEQSSTNLLLQSQAFDSINWTRSNVTVTADATTAPDGTTTADSVIAMATNSVHRVRQSVIATGTFTFSLYVKPNGYTKIGIWDDTTTGAYASFNCTGSGSVLASGAGASSAAITALPNGWYRISYVASVVGTVGFAIQILDPTYTTGGINVPWLADGVSGFYFWGAQLEALAFPTSYIPTTTAQVTRAADVASMTGTNFSSWYNASEGTLFAESSTITTNTYAYIANLCDGNAGQNEIALRIVNPNYSADSVVNSVAQADMNIGSFVTGVFSKTIMAYKTNDFAGTKNGGTVATDTLGTVPTVNQLVIGTQRTAAPSTFTLTGYVKKISYYQTRLTNSQLQALTT